MTNDWQTLPLGSICQIKTGKKDVNQGNPKGKFPFFTCAKEHTFSDEYSFDGDAILVAGNGDVGNVQIYSGKFEAYQRTYVLMNFGDVTPQYLFHTLEGGLKPALYDQKLGNTMPYIKKGMLADFQISFPPIDEQRRIVAVLDKAFAGIVTATANAQKNLTNARALFESTLSDIFDRQGSSWPQFRLGDVGKTMTGNTPKTGDKENFGDFLPFIKPGNFLPDGSLSYDGGGLSAKGAQSSRIVPAGSALMVCIGATIGKSGYSDRRITANQQINAIVPKDGVVGKFLYYQFLTPSFQRSVDDGSGQATLPIISKSKWSDLPIRLPSNKAQQISAVKKLDEISDKSQQLLGIGRSKLAALSELKQSLLQKAFAGELT